MTTDAARITDETQFHLRDLTNALRDMEEEAAGNDAHYRAIRAAIRAVEWLLVEQRNAAQTGLRATATT